MFRSLVLIGLMGCADPVPSAPLPVLEESTVVFTTTLGTFELALYANTPISTANFRQYVEDGFFDGTDGEGATLFHRVVPQFVVQAGGVTAEGVWKMTRDPIENESSTGLSNKRGTVAMARTDVLDSATSQFFVNLVDNDFLDAQRGSNGYAVFGEVVLGMDVIDAIAAVPLLGEEPETPVIIESAL